MLLPGPHPLAGLEAEGLASTLVDMLFGEQITGLPCAGLMTATTNNEASHSVQQRNELFMLSNLYGGSLGTQSLLAFPVAQSVDAVFG